MDNPGPLITFGCDSAAVRIRHRDSACGELEIGAETDVSVRNLVGLEKRIFMV